MKLFSIFLLITFFNVKAADIKKLEKECLLGNLASCVKKEAIKSGIDPKSSEVIVEDKSATKKDKVGKYELECEAEEWWACHNLAVLYEKTGKPAESEKLYEKACNKGDITESCYNVGVILNKKSGKKEAKPFFEKACKEKHCVSCYNLGIIEYDFKNKKRARKLFTGACKCGVKEACVRGKL